jgi:hypothetical protein
MIGGFTFTSIGAASRVNAASAPASINLIYYGSNSSTTDQSIINANPEYLVNNSPAGPWGGNANISKFMSAGIKYFEYIDGGYEGTVSQAIPNDLQSNLNYINAIAKAGAYGVFIDEVSASPSASALNYLKQLADRAHSLGLKVVFNAGVDSWSDSLMNYCDFINSSEVWNNNPLTASQIKWASRTWFLTQGVNDAATAANLTEAAWSKGVEAEYVCNSYVALPTWLASYITLIESSSATPVTTPVVVNTPVTTPVVVNTPVTTPVVVNTPVTTPIVVNNPVTTPVVVNTPVTTPVVVNTPVTTPVVVNTPVTTTVVVNTPITTPVVVNTPVTAPVVVNTPVTTTVIAITPIAAPVVANTPIATLVVANTPIATLVVVNTPVTTPVVVKAPITAPVVTNTTIAAPVIAITPPPASGKTGGTFFSRLWHPVAAIWHFSLNLLGI